MPLTLAQCIEPRLRQPEAERRQRFVAAGLVRMGGIPCLSFDSTASVPNSRAGALDVRSIDDPQALADHASVIAQAFDFEPAQLARVLTPRLLDNPAWRGYVGYDGATPVATSQLIVSETTVGIYYVATVESARGRCYGEAVTARGVAGRSRIRMRHNAAPVVAYGPAHLRAPGLSERGLLPHVRPGLTAASCTLR